MKTRRGYLFFFFSLKRICILSYLFCFRFYSFLLLVILGSVCWEPKVSHEGQKNFFVFPIYGVLILLVFFLSLSFFFLSWLKREGGSYGSWQRRRSMNFGVDRESHFCQ